MKNKLIKMKLCNFYITQQQYDNIKIISERTGLSYSEHIRRALDNYIKEQQK
jgi:hypothetical protein